MCNIIKSSVKEFLFEKSINSIQPSVRKVKYLSNIYRIRIKLNINYFSKHILCKLRERFHLFRNVILPAKPRKQLILDVLE